MNFKYKRKKKLDPVEEKRLDEQFESRRMTAEQEELLRKQIAAGRIITYISEDGTEECR